jgi:phosphatidylglycerophosphate synthase
VGRYRTHVRDVAVCVAAGVAVSVVAALVLDAAYPSGGWKTAAAAAIGVAPTALAAVAVLRRRPAFITPADRVTLGRAALACGCAAMTALVLLGPAPARDYWLFALSVPTLLLDAVDGQVARRTGTATEEGALLDMQVDAGVLAVLSLAVATALGWWVVLIGAMRYLYVVASWGRPVLATPLPRNRFRVVVGGTQGGVLAGALAPFVPAALATTAVAVALGLLVVSFGSHLMAAERAAAGGPTRI